MKTNIEFYKDNLTQSVIALFPENEYNGEVLGYSKQDGFFRTSYSFIRTIYNRASREEYSHTLAALRAKVRVAA
jgi:hypothetical protein